MDQKNMDSVTLANLVFQIPLLASLLGDLQDGPHVVLGMQGQPVWYVELNSASGCQYIALCVKRNETRLIG